MNILVTGGTGFIGSHTVVELINAGHTATAVDNLVNSSEEAISRIEKITGKKVPFFKADLRDRDAMKKVMESSRFDCCMHFAGLKAVGESVVKPLEYYDNNLNGTLVLLEMLREYDVKSIIFSSSATVYGTPQFIPITEEHPKGECSNPYGKTKSMIEDILVDLNTADLKNGNEKPWNIVLLRYFNPIGAHSSGLLGENPSGIPNNLMPYITQVAVGKLHHLSVYGNDYETHDGTGVRDYIHVVDLAKGHVKALKAIEENWGVKVYNLGTGKGYSVLDIVNSFISENGVDVPYVICDRRPGDLAEYYSDPGKAEKELGWKAELDIKDMVRDSWNFQKNNPNGF
ncbi:MAG: UDP-glucose 4-epimerase GalE [Clostridia bacterium]|nr:UDP-glucose 4-epimerase GalE [Clostridia bacterium]